MSGFNRVVKKVLSFEDDNVNVEMNRLSRADMYALKPYIETVVKVSAGSDVSISKDEFEYIVHASNDVITRNVKITGLYDAGGNELSIDDIVNETYFSSFIGEIIGNLVAISQPSSSEKKLVKKQPSET